jgi:hypothetical protein
VQRHAVVDVTARVVDVARSVARALLDNVRRHSAVAVRLCLTADTTAVSHRMSECATTARKYITQYPGLRAGTDASAHDRAPLGWRAGSAAAEWGGRRDADHLTGH